MAQGWDKLQGWAVAQSTDFGVWEREESESDEAMGHETGPGLTNGGTEVDRERLHAVSVRLEFAPEFCGAPFLHTNQISCLSAASTFISFRNAHLSTLGYRIFPSTHT